MVQDLRKTRLGLQTANMSTVMFCGFESIPGGQEMLSMMCSHESLDNLIDFPPFSHSGNVCILFFFEISLWILKMESLHLISTVFLPAA